MWVFIAVLHITRDGFDFPLDKAPDGTNNLLLFFAEGNHHRYVLFLVGSRQFSSFPQRDQVMGLPAGHELGKQISKQAIG